MKTFPLRHSGCYLDPFLVQEAQRQRMPGTVTDTGVAVGAHHFVFTVEVLPIGAEVEVGLNPTGFFARLRPDLAVETHPEQEWAAAEGQRQQQAATQHATRAFVARYALPFVWTVGIKDVLGGLGARSVGDGRRRETVDHCLVLESFQRGRLKRQKGDFLCTTVAGKRWVEPGNDAATPSRPVTCPTCLARMARWKRAGESPAADADRPGARAHAV